MSIIRKILDQYPNVSLTYLLLPIIIGLICGLEAIIVRTVIPTTFSAVMGLVNRAGNFSLVAILGFLIFGGLMTGFIASRKRETTGVGLDVAIENYHMKSGIMSSSFAPLKFLSTLFTLGLGGSGGLVGPTAAIGQGTVSWLSKWFDLRPDKSKLLALCGVSACVSGLLHTPFGAAIFALELCYLSGIIYEDLIPVLLSSISAYIMGARIIRMLPFGHSYTQPHLFRTVIYGTPFPWSMRYLLYCFAAALIVTAVGILFVKTFLSLQDFSRKYVDERYSPIFGLALVGIVAVLFFRNQLTDVLGESGELVEDCAMGNCLLSTALILLIGRWATTFLTVGFGGSGGLFSPTVLIGSLAGTIVARLFGIDNTIILITTGVSSALTSVMNVPIAAIIIVIEAFGISFIIPAAIGSATAFLLAGNWVIYPNIQKFQEAKNQIIEDL